MQTLQRYSGWSASNNGYHLWPCWLLETIDAVSHHCSTLLLIDSLGNDCNNNNTRWNQTTLSAAIPTLAPTGLPPYVDPCYKYTLLNISHNFLKNIWSSISWLTNIGSIWINQQMNGSTKQCTQMISDQKLNSLLNVLNFTGEFGFQSLRSFLYRPRGLGLFWAKTLKRHVMKTLITKMMIIYI